MYTIETPGQQKPTPSRPQYHYTLGKYIFIWRFFKEFNSRGTFLVIFPYYYSNIGRQGSKIPNVILLRY